MYSGCRCSLRDGWLGVLTFLSTIYLTCLVSNTSDLIAAHLPTYCFDVRADNLIYHFLSMRLRRTSLHVTCYDVWAWSVLDLLEEGGGTH